VYFAGGNSLSYLNASLMSVHKYFNLLPEVVIVSDGTEKEIIIDKLIKWPKNIDIIDYSVCAKYFEDKGNKSLAGYAAKDLWGKKFVGLMYCFEHWEVLYTDTDVLWFGDPTSSIPINIKKPFIKMSPDLESCYSTVMLTYLDEKSLEYFPLNAGVIFGTGDFSLFNKWENLCAYLEAQPDNRTEQTAFALFTKYFGHSWPNNEIFLRVDDISSILPIYFPQRLKFIARHYVNTKGWLFWRDFLIFVLFHR
jgi:hypothetical protein